MLAPIPLVLHHTITIDYYYHYYCDYYYSTFPFFVVYYSGRAFFGPRGSGFVTKLVPNGQGLRPRRFGISFGTICASKLFMVFADVVFILIA